MTAEATDPYAALRRFIANPPKNAALVFATSWHVLAAELMRRMMCVVDAAEHGGEIQQALADLRAAVNRRPAPEPTNGVEL